MSFAKIFKQHFKAETIEELRKLAEKKGVSKEYIKEIFKKKSEIDNLRTAVMYNVNESYTKDEKTFIRKFMYDNHYNDLKSIWNNNPNLMALNIVDIDTPEALDALQEFIIRVMFRDDRCLNSIPRMKENLRYIANNEAIKDIITEKFKIATNTGIKPNTEQIVEKINSLRDIEVCEKYLGVAEGLGLKFKHNAFNGSISTRGKTPDQIRLMISNTVNQEMSFNKYYFGSKLSKVIKKQKIPSDKLLKDLGSVRRSIRRTFPVPLERMNELTKQTLFEGINDERIQYLKNAQLATMNAYVREAKLPYKYDN